MFTVTSARFYSHTITRLPSVAWWGTASRADRHASESTAPAAGAPVTPRSELPMYCRRRKKTKQKNVYQNSCLPDEDTSLSAYQRELLLLVSQRSLNKIEAKWIVHHVFHGVSTLFLFPSPLILQFPQPLHLSQATNKYSTVSAAPRATIII